MGTNGVVNVNKWLTDNKDQFHPPVCNKMMSDDYIKIMFVGGPNSRKDFHLDQGEEFFYMLKGDMLLKVMERGVPKDVYIREGEVFRLPSRIPHSPQRFENTIGLVIERQRKDEWDGLRFYCDDGTTILWQKFFYLNSLVKDLPPVFEEYFSSDQYKTRKPIPGTTGNEVGDDPSKFIVDQTTILEPPFKLKPWIEENLHNIKGNARSLFDGGEFDIKVYGEGRHDIAKVKYETWYWHQKGNGDVNVCGTSNMCSEGDSLIIPADVDVTINIETNGYGILFLVDAWKSSLKGIGGEF